MKLVPTKFWTALCGLRIRHLGPNDEVISHSYLPAWGRFFISDLATRMRAHLMIGPGTKSHSENIKIRSLGQSFQISMPANYSLLSADSKVLWEGNDHFDADRPSYRQMRASFEFPALPAGLSVAFPNHQRIEISRSHDYLRFWAPAALTFACLVMAAMVHIGFVGLTAMSARYETIPNFLIAKAIPDVSKIAIGFGEPTPPASEMSPAHESHSHPTAPLSAEQAKMASAKNLLRSWGVPGKAIEDANRVLKPTRFDQFEGGDDSETKTAINKSGWKSELAIADASNNANQTIKLNLTESQIALIMRATYPQLRECYNDVLIKDSSLNGKLELEVQVAKTSGLVTQVNFKNLEASPQSASQLKSCFMRAYQAIHFPHPNEAFSVVHTLSLNNN